MNFDSLLGLSADDVSKELHRLSDDELLLIAGDPRLHLHDRLFVVVLVEALSSIEILRGVLMANQSLRLVPGINWSKILGVDPAVFGVFPAVPFLDSLSEGHFPYELAYHVGDEIAVSILDIKSTGASIHSDRLVELGVVRLSYSPSQNRFTSIDAMNGGFHDPGIPIPAVASANHGITDGMVAGCVITDQDALDWIGEDSIVIAHNASKVRPVFERQFHSLGYYQWGCSLKGIDWQSRVSGTRALDHLIFKFGYAFNSQRSMDSALALAWLLNIANGASAELIQSVNTETTKILAVGAPFSVKDVLKEHNYEWSDGSDGPERGWWIEVPVDDVNVHYDLLDALYQGGDFAHYVRMDSRVRFKA